VIAGRYSLEREIGRGGMGAVWLGLDEVLGREVALKRIGLLPGADSTDLARAEREARLTARLSHPHVVSVFNLVIDTDSDACWLVMEYVEGTTLSQLVKDEGAIAPDEAAPLLWQAADALVAAHAAGIVHRDVKPSNILVDLDRRVKLTDFGIARIAADPSLTQTGFVTGSPAYLSPEVAAGHRGDEAVDVWSLGATIFYVLSGRAPYQFGDNVLGGLYRIVNEEPPRLADAGWLSPLLAATMEKDPARRWTMVQVRDFLAGTSGQAVPTALYRDRDVTAEDTQPTPAPVPVAVPPETAVAPAPAPPPDDERDSARPPLAVLLAGAAVVLVLAMVLFAVLRDGGPSDDTASTDPSTPADTTSSPSPSASQAAAGPTAAGMETFVRDYVNAIAADPTTSWRMLTPEFQQKSGPIDKYRRFWDGKRNPQIFDISADPENLVVSYHVKFDNFGTGKRPTVLELEYADGRYRIADELTPGTG
jgi:serine/threonine protein kinase